MSRPLLDADYSAIEARIVNWLAGQEDALEEYRQGVDRYKVMASTIYGVPVEEVNKYPQRFVGKQAILLSGFQGGASSFEKTCLKYKFTPPLGLAELAVAKFREKHPRVVSYWYDTEAAAQKAVLHKGETFRITNKRTGPYKVPVSFCVKNLEGVDFLLCKLPSGRELSYPRPRLVPSRFEGKKMIEFFGAFGTAKNFGKADTYGGKLVENITQAVAADIMANGAHNAENAGYEIATLIHDQALAYYQEWQTPEEFVDLLTRLPAWADGLPIEAEGGLVPFYKKD